MEDREKLIQAYINKELTDEQWKELAALTKSDPEFVSELHIATVLKAEQNIDYKNYLKSISEEKEKSKILSENKKTAEPKKIKRFPFVKIAATLLLILGVYGTYNYFNQNSQESIMASYWNQTNELSHLATTLGDASEKDILKKAYLFYQKDEFLKCQEVLKSVQPQNENDLMNKLLLEGMSSFDLGAYGIATQKFKAVIDHSNNLYNDSAEWFLALTYLKTGNTQKAKELLESIKAKQSLHWQKASDLLEN